ncbi:MAG: recombinase family protein [Anaerolineaceae bacterium]|nr:MAG: recombinase family protein [Anaerolineaceae bacterium]
MKIMPNRKRCHTPTSGWAIYLRTSSQDAQNPANSQRRQRHAIQQSLLQRSDLPIIAEYTDTLSGRSADRPDYQRMLRDARRRQFSHVAVENAERFGRNDTEALAAIDELHRLGIAVRFADYPDLDPIDPDDRIMVSLSFTLARRESIKLGQRTKGGQFTKLRNGGWAWRAPDGYLNCEERTDSLEKSQDGRYRRWIEPDPERFHIWREAWDLLLEDRYTLREICEKLHQRGYTFRTGRPFIAVKSSGKRWSNHNGLSRVFHNWFYAGWVVNDEANILPKTVRGQWKPTVTTEEFEQGLAILHRRGKKNNHKRKHHYLLRGLIYVRSQDKKPRKLTGSTSNTGRPGGGTAYYRTSGSDINILCRVVDRQIPALLHNIQIDPDLIPIIRQCYVDEIAEKLGHRGDGYETQLRAALAAVDSEEARTLRLYASGKVSEAVWNNLWAEWQDRRDRLRQNLATIGQEQQANIQNLDDALAWIAKLAILYETQSLENQHELLRLIVERVVVDHAGNVIEVALRPPFAYIHSIRERVEGDQAQSENAKRADNFDSPHTGNSCSNWVSFVDPNGRRGPSCTPSEHRHRACA